jgi:hypothetical protein
MSVQVQLHPCHEEAAGLWQTEVPTSTLRSTGRCPDDNVIKLFLTLVIDAVFIIPMCFPFEYFSLALYLRVSLGAYVEFGAIRFSTLIGACLTHIY